MKHAASLVSEYGRDDMPSLKDAIESTRLNDAPVRILIRAGASRHWFGKRQLKRVHAHIRYRGGREVSRSKSLTDELLDAPVARILRDPEHRTVCMLVFIPYGRYKARDGHYAEPRPSHCIVWSGLAGTEPPREKDIFGDDELPF